MIKAIRNAKYASKKRSMRRKSRKTKSNMNSQYKGVMRGGDDGRYSLPAEYFGKNSGAYYPDGSRELNLSGQMAVSRGVIHSNGQWAGPDLRPTMNGGGCGCRRKYNKSLSKGSKHMKPTHKN